MTITTTGHVAGEQLMELMDGELTGATLRAVEEHVETCGVCASEVATLREERSTLRAWGVGEASDRTEEQVLARVREWSEGATPDARRLLGPRGRWWAWGGAGALAAGALTMVLVVAGGGRAPLPGGYSPQRQELRVQAPAPAGAGGGGDAKAAKSASSQMATMADGHRGASAGVAGISPDVAAPAVASEQMLAPPADRVARATTAAQGGRTSPPVADTAAPMIARSVALTLTVKDVERSRESLDGLLKAYGGYAAQMEVSTPDGGVRSLRASLRVPSGQMRGMLAELKGEGKVENETQSGEEVGQQHADLVARLTTARESEERLRGILKTRTGDLSDVLQVEEEIARIRGEIEGMEAEQQGLEHRVSYATIELQMDEEGHGPAARTVGSQLAAAARQGWENGTAAVLGLMLFLLQYGFAVVLVTVLLGGPSWWVWRRWRRVRARW